MRAHIEEALARGGPEAEKIRRAGGPEAVLAMMQSLSTARAEEKPISQRRADGNRLFKAGDCAAAVAAYKEALEDPDEDRLPLLSNLGLCLMKLRQFEAATTVLTEATSLTASMHAAPELATKAAARLFEALVGRGLVEAADHSSGPLADALRVNKALLKGLERRALADFRHYARRCTVSGLKALGMPPPPDEELALALIFAVTNAPRGAAGLEQVRAALARSPAEAYDSRGNSALALGVETACRATDQFGSQLVALLLQKGTPPDVRAPMGQTALMTAALKGRVELCELLVRAGASVDATDSRGLTPLHFACSDLLGEGKGSSWVAEHERVVALLLENGAAVDAQSVKGVTALMYCAQQLRGARARDVGPARLLLGAGALTTPRITAAHAAAGELGDGITPGHTARDFALECADRTGSSPMLELLDAAAVAEGEAAPAVAAAPLGCELDGD